MICHSYVLLVFGKCVVERWDDVSFWGEGAGPYGIAWFDLFRLYRFEFRHCVYLSGLPDYGIVLFYHFYVSRYRRVGRCLCRCGYTSAKQCAYHICYSFHTKFFYFLFYVWEKGTDLMMESVFRPVSVKTMIYSLLFIDHLLHLFV